MKAIFSLALVAALCVMVGCEKKRDVKVDAPGVKVEAGPDGATVETPKAKVEADKEGTTVDTPKRDVKVDVDK